MEKIDDNVIKADVEKQENSWFSPFRIIIALFLILILILMVVPYYSVKLDPEPSKVVSIYSVQQLVPEGNYSVASDVSSLLEPSDPTIKLVADTIVTQSCGSDDICQAKALFYFVRDNFDYVSDPSSHEYVKSSLLSIRSGGGDCDDASVLLANLLQAIGIKTRFVFVPRHVFVQAYIPEALKKYRSDADWVYLDAACKSCGFGELSYSVGKQEMRYS